ncbi:MAG: ferrous iron transport protein A [Deltaproteobacteria bacterium]|nr:ferrous iron transport protein A [Candidatus Anaeroferrophillacea bacterium]
MNDQTPAPTRPLSTIHSGCRCRVVRLDGGPNMTQRLDSMGLRIGSIVNKVSNNPFRGPVVFRIDQTELAIGYGMASRIMVEEI